MKRVTARVARRNRPNRRPPARPGNRCEWAIPELPEVETVRRDLEPFLTGRIVSAVAITRDRAVRRQSHADFAAALTDRRFTHVRRHGKFLIVDLEHADALVVHLRMSGQLRINEPSDGLLKHSHVVIDLDNGTQLRFVDPRTFGEMFVDSLDGVGRPLSLCSSGPDAVDPKVTSAVLYERLTAGRRTSSVKSALLDQRAIAGVGNIYADEALFAAGIHPERLAPTLTPAEAVQLNRHLRRILLSAIEARGSTLSDYVDAYGRAGRFAVRHKVYGRAGSPCPVCAVPIEKTTVAQRGTHFCPQCQPL